MDIDQEAVRNFLIQYLSEGPPDGDHFAPLPTMMSQLQQSCRDTQYGISNPRPVEHRYHQPESVVPDTYTVSSLPSDADQSEDSDRDPHDCHQQQHFRGDTHLQEHPSEGLQRHCNEYQDEKHPQNFIGNQQQQNVCGYAENNQQYSEGNPQEHQREGSNNGYSHQIEQKFASRNPSENHIRHSIRNPWENLPPKQPSTLRKPNVIYRPPIVQELFQESPSIVNSSISTSHQTDRQQIASATQPPDRVFSRHSLNKLRRSGSCSSFRRTSSSSVSLNRPVSAINNSFSRHNMMSDPSPDGNMWHTARDMSTKKPNMDLEVARARARCRPTTPMGKARGPARGTWSTSVDRSRLSGLRKARESTVERTHRNYSVSRGNLFNV